MANRKSQIANCKNKQIDNTENASHNAVNLRDKFAALPSVELLMQQAEWLAPARTRLLRRVGIAHRQRVLDLGAGYGAVTGELVRRAGGSVVALDSAVSALRSDAGRVVGAWRVGGDAACLPFESEAFDLVFSQLTLLWVKALDAALDEVWRVLVPNGVLVALEPDYGGLMEYPPDIAARKLWLSALSRAGAEPHIGRKLPDFLSRRGFDVRVSLLDTLCAPSPTRFEFLRELPLTDEETITLDNIEREVMKCSGEWAQVAHLPFFLITAKKL